MKRGLASGIGQRRVSGSTPESATVGSTLRIAERTGVASDGGVATGRDQQRDRAHGRLRQRRIERRRRLLGHAMEALVAHDAHHGPRAAPEADPGAEGIPGGRTGAPRPG